MNYRYHGSSSVCRRGKQIVAKVGLSLCMLGVVQTIFISAPEAQYLTPSGITFSATAGAGAPSNQTITLNPVATQRTRTWTVSKDTNWLQVSPTSGDIRNDTDLLTVNVSTTGISQGIYTDTILITLVDPAGVVRTTSTSVTLNLSGGTSSPSIALSPASLSFTGFAGGAVPAAKTISLTNPGGGSLSWNITSSAPWLVVTPATGSTSTETDTISVTANTAGLSAGAYSGLLTIGGNGTNVPQQVTVSLTLSGQSGGSPALSVSPTSLTANVPVGSSATYMIDVTNAGGGGALNWTVTDPVDWLLKSVGSGTTPGALQVTLDPYQLPEGTYQTSITVKAPGVSGSPKIIPVTMTVGQGGTSSSQSLPQSPSLSVSPTNLSFSAPVDSAPLTSHVNISNSGGGGSVQWSVTDPIDWLVKSIDYGVTPGVLAVTVYPSVLPTGTHSTSITVMLPGAANSPVTIPVTLTVGSTTTASAIVSWNANSESDLSGYKIYYGTASGNYSTSINVGKVTTYTVNGLSTGRTYYFAVAALDQAGNESVKSDEATVVR